jgi:hypothetical protein
MAGFEGAFTDSQNWARSMAKKTGDVVSDAVDLKKTAEAAILNSRISNVGGTGLSGAEYVASRGGINSEGYYNDVDAHRQLTANERIAVTNKDGTINTGAMLQRLKEKEAEYNAKMGITPRGGGSTSSASITATPLAPEPEMLSARMFSVSPVKTAPIDTILFDDAAVPIEIMSDLIFENIGGQELISIVRSDIVNGQKISYQPIKNLSSIQQQYNPNNILGLQQTANRLFAGFSIKLEDKIPEVGNGLNGENIYFDESTGDLIIEFINLNNDEQIETQITVNGTIYEANLGDYTS